MKKIAIIGASYLQAPLIEKAKQLGLETHVFAWASNDVGKKLQTIFPNKHSGKRRDIIKMC